jgi:hypothetical protein
MRLTVAGEMLKSAAICLPVWRARRSIPTCSATACGVAFAADEVASCGRAIQANLPDDTAQPTYEPSASRRLRLR